MLKKNEKNGNRYTECLTCSINCNGFVSQSRKFTDQTGTMAFEVYSNEYLIRGLMKSASVEKCACFQWQLALFFPPQCYN